MPEIRNSILVGLVFGLLFGLFIALLFEYQYALIAGPASGMAFGLLIYLFATSKTVKEQTQIELAGEDTIIRSGGANHIKNAEGVGGKLYLLKDKLQFKSHGFNVQNHVESIALNQIKEVRFYNTLGLVPNGLLIETIDGRMEKFVVNGRRSWKEEIDKLKSDHQQMDSL